MRSQTSTPEEFNFVISFTLIWLTLPILADNFHMHFCNDVSELLCFLKSAEVKSLYVSHSISRDSTLLFLFLFASKSALYRVSEPNSTSVLVSVKEGLFLISSEKKNTNSSSLGSRPNLRSLKVIHSPGTVVATFCCFTSVLVMLYGSMGLSLLLGWLDNICRLRYFSSSLSRFMPL